jgi:hypothetical protein
VEQDRRDFLKTVGLGTGVAAAGTTLGGVGALGVREAQATIFAKKTVKLSEVYEQFGKYVCLLPGKFAGTVSAVDLSTGLTMGWIALWNYGNTSPIMHHMTCFPSEDPYKGFEYIVNTQGGKNLYIYGIPTTVKEPGEGFNIYKVRWDGTKMNLVSDIAEKTGLGLGVHVTCAPDATGFAVADGQKDIFAEFDRATETVRSAWFFDWSPKNTTVLEKAWLDGGTLTIKRLKPTLADNLYDYKGTKGVKLDWELVPGGELFAEQGKVTGPRVANTCALDAFVYDPRGKWGALAIRLLGLAIIFDREKWQPVAALLAPKGEASQTTLVKVDDDTWKIDMPKVVTPAHQAGFSPDGKNFLFMNGVRQNNIMVWDTTNHADPTKWEKKAVVEDPSWRGSYPNTFHMVFTPDAKKCYVTLWWPSPTPNGIAVVDAVNWKLLKSIDLGPDMHTLAMTYDGKWLIGVISGYQKTTSGIVIMETATDEVIGFLPSASGHHDNVIVPRTLEDLRISRSTTT